MERSQLSSLFVLSGHVWGFILTQGGGVSVCVRLNQERFSIQHAEHLYPTNLSHLQKTSRSASSREALVGDLGQGDDREGDGRDARGNVAGGVAATGGRKRRPSRQSHNGR